MFATLGDALRQYLITRHGLPSLPFCFSLRQPTRRIASAAAQQGPTAPLPRRRLSRLSCRIVVFSISPRSIFLRVSP